MLIAILYTVASGFTTVVYTDVYQSVFIFASFVIVAAMGIATSLPDHFVVFVPTKLEHHGAAPSLLNITYTKSAWLSAVPTSRLTFPDDAAYSMYNSFGLVLGTYLLLQTMRSASGPGGSGLQSVLATKSEREVRSQTFLAMMLLALRWAFSSGVAVLAIRYTLDNAGVSVDPERVVPVVIDKMLPAGVKGFVLASLFAAALTTFDTTINSSSAYWTVDIYHALVNPSASEQQLLWHARASTVVVMLSGLLLSLYVDSINHIWGFMTIAVAGGFVWPFFFSWYWSRFNAYSCLVGVLSGFLAAFATFMYVCRVSGCVGCMSCLECCGPCCCRVSRPSLPPSLTSLRCCHGCVHHTQLRARTPRDDDVFGHLVRVGCDVRSVLPRDTTSGGPSAASVLPLRASARRVGGREAHVLHARHSARH